MQKNSDMPAQLKRYTLTHEGIEANVKEFRTSRSLRIIVHPDCSITITCPPRTSKMAVAGYMKAHIDWIKKTVKKFEQRPSSPKHYITAFKSRCHTLEFRISECKVPKVEINNELILVKYPKTYDICSNEIQQLTFKAITKALKSEANNYLPLRIKNLAIQNGLQYSMLTITSTTSKWGSCDNRKRIRISCFVMTLTDELIDLILLHELAHTIHMNHSAKFHNLLNAMLPQHNEHELNQKLKNYRITKP